MPTWLSTIISLLTSKLTGWQAWIAKLILKYGGQYLLELYQKFVRKVKQDKAEKKVEEDVKNQTPRNEETKKNEKDWMNS